MPLPEPQPATALFDTLTMHVTQGGIIFIWYLRIVPQHRHPAAPSETPVLANVQASYPLT